MSFGTSTGFFLYLSKISFCIYVMISDVVLFLFITIWEKKFHLSIEEQ